MDPLTSHIDLNDETHLRNRQAMESILAEFRARAEIAQMGGGVEAVAKHKSRGKMLARERIDALLDDGSAFLEFSMLAANGMYKDEAPGAGIVTGIGRIHGRECMIVANERSRSTFGPRKSRSKTTCLAFTWWIQVEPSCHCRAKCFPIVTTSAVFSTTKR